MMRAVVAIAIACAACNEPDRVEQQPVRSHEVARDAAPRPRHGGGGEVKGTIRHMHRGGDRYEEAGGSGELDPVHSIWGADAHDIYAAAWDDPGRGLLHSRGDGTWTHESLQDRRLLAVWGSSAHDIYVGGNDHVYHGHGDGTWTAEDVHPRGATRGLWGSGSHDVYAAAAYGQIFHSTGGGKWTEQHAGSGDLLLAISGCAANDVYAAGDHGHIYHSAGDGKWKLQAALPTAGKDFISGLWCGAKDDVYAVGPGLYHSKGDGKWERVAVDGLAEASSVWGDGKGTLYVGGDSGELFTRRDGTWSHTTDRGGGEYQALWGAGDDVYIGTERFFEDSPDPATRDR